MRGVLLACVVAVAGCGRKPAEPTGAEVPPPRVVAAEPTRKAEPVPVVAPVVAVPTAKAEPVVGPVAWQAVFDAYKANEVAADLKYRGKRVQVILNTITHIGVNDSGRPYLGTLNVIPSNDPTGVFVFAEGESEGVAKLRIRQPEPVRVEGRCDGKTVDGIRRAGLTGFDFYVKFRECKMLP